MENIKSYIYFYHAAALFLFISFTSCKKNTVSPSTDCFGIDTSRVYLSDTYENNLRDSIWYYYKLFSLWQEVIPPSSKNHLALMREPGFLRTNYTQYFRRGDDVLDFLKSLTKNKLPNRIPEKNYDWYSLLDRGGYISDEVQGTIKSGFGLTVFFLQANNQNNADPYIRLVERNSPAYSAGLQRGDKIISINGDTNLDYNYQNKINFRSLKEHLNSNFIQIRLQKTNGDYEDISITKRSYTNSPLITQKIINNNSKKIGYFLLSSFASITERGVYSNFHTELENLFSNFETEEIDELVVDLRENGGGDVETAIYLANKITPSSSNGELMLRYEINQFLRELGWADEGEEFAPVKFKKSGNLELRRVYFLVSSSTASASELLINILKPVMCTHMIGTNIMNDKNEVVAEKTYGKPVGFFEINVVDDHVGLYPASFKMYNKDGEGDYFNGLTPNSHVWEFKNFYDFGDPKESMLAEALGHILNKSPANNKALRTTTNRTINDQFLRTRGYIEENSASKVGVFKFKKAHLSK